MRRVLVTGASGFLGAALCRELCMRGFVVRGAGRSLLQRSLRDFVEPVVVSGGIDSNNWSSALVGVDYVVHCAALAHGGFLNNEAALTALRSVNVEGSRVLAEQAAKSGVKRFVFLSSIGVLGTHTNERGPFNFSDSPSPVEAYAISKLEAEQALSIVSDNSRLELVTVRPPLVYGPCPRGNLGRLLRLVRLGVPLPFAAIQNQRSFVGVDNLVDFLIRCLEHPSAAGQALLVSDGEDVSTPDLLRHMAGGFGRSSRLFATPVSTLRFAGRMLGKQVEIDRLISSLQVDSRYSWELLNWVPPVGLADGIRRMVQAV